MDFKGHCEITRMVFGSDFSDVHRWLDGTFAQFPDDSPYNHWLPHHHLKAIKDRFTSNSDEFRAACLHVVCDWLWHWDEWHLPEDREEVGILLRECGVRVVA